MNSQKGIVSLILLLGFVFYLLLAAETIVGYASLLMAARDRVPFTAEGRYLVFMVGLVWTFLIVVAMGVRVWFRNGREGPAAGFLSLLVMAIFWAAQTLPSGGDGSVNTFTLVAPIVQILIILLALMLRPIKPRPAS